MFINLPLQTLKEDQPETSCLSYFEVCCGNVPDKSILGRDGPGEEGRGKGWEEGEREGGRTEMALAFETSKPYS